jgi:hypothetical protein
MTLSTFTPSARRGEHPIAADLRGVITEAARRAPRSQQVALGPSEIGEPCARQLAYKLMHHPASNAESDPWPSIVGTAVHEWLASAFTAANTRLGRIRYLVEQSVTIRDGLSGTCDLYDADHARVIDHKVPGATSMTEQKKRGPRAGYRSQIHLYGLGFARMGLPVRDVALALYPRGGLLSGLWIWSEPYDETVALAALARHDAILEAASALDVSGHPDRYRMLPRETGHHCTYCPFWSAGPDTGDGCPGTLADGAP